MIWKQPLYRFRIPETVDSETLKEIVIDVTGSAPPFEDVKDAMSDVYDKFLSSVEGKKVESVIDFGAAKLRNTLYFLQKGKKVAAVEFEELSKSSDQAKRIWKKCKKYKGLFEDWIYPFPFLNHRKTYDMALLINVLPIMPVFSERLMVLQVLHEKITGGGYILWYAQKEGSYKERRLAGKYNCGDGIWTGDNKYLKMFFKYHCIEEVDEMMGINGFEFVKKFTVPGNDVRLYKKIKYNLLKGVITEKKIFDSIPIDLTIKDPTSKKLKILKPKKGLKEILPNPSSLSFQNLYRETLKKIPSGKETPEAPEIYHRLTSHLLNRIFRDSLSGMDIKQEMDGGLKIIDTVYNNVAENGFFHDLSDKFKIKCPYIIVEAKNYTYDPNNPEFDQLAGRLKDNVGKFGILICREIKDEETVKKRCISYLDEGKYVVVLTDDDLIQLLELYEDGDLKGINEFMDKKLRPLIFKSPK